jgi:ATP-dependent helicase/nuclease subunit A
MGVDTLQWTEQQAQAIQARGRDLLVTASAGTGKTAVLSQRCVDILQQAETPTSILNLLILTFTDSAAEEMRTRIREKLVTAAAHDPAARRLQRELLWLPGASISTIHAFCKQIITEHFHTLGLDPSFRLMDTDEQRLLKTETLRQVLDWAWQQEALAQGLKALLRQRDVSVVQGFPCKILTLSDFLDGVVSRRQWYERARARAESGLSQTGEWAQAQQALVVEKVRELETRLQAIFQFYEEHCTEAQPPALPNAHLMDTLQQIQTEAAAGHWPECVAAVHAFSKKNVTKPKAVDEAQASFIQTQLKQITTEFLNLRDWAVLTPDYVERMAQAVCLQTLTLVELTEEFDRLYRAAKQRSNCLDFADLEHYALKVLTEPDAKTGALRPSRSAQTLQQQYHHVFVDEYQDVNPVQEAIIRAVQRGDNLFVVGDVKQSIYAFRGAQPGIFQARLEPATPLPAEGKALRIDLNTNFRSEQGILDFVNQLFRPLITRASGGMAYDESAWLRPLQSRAVDEPLVELHILDEQETITTQAPDESMRQADRLNAVTSRQRQAALVAQRILHLLGRNTQRPALQIKDKMTGQFRDLAFRDIAILMRSPARRVDDYVGILRTAGIPVNTTQSAGYFDATEIRDCLNVLKVLDNPQRDIEMAAVLRGPFFNRTDTDLLRIKLASTQDGPQSFYDRVVNYSQNGVHRDLVDGLKHVLQRLAHWRQKARESSLSDLIWTLIRTEGLLSMVMALPGAQVRRANLLKLHDRAIQFEGFASNQGAVSLHRFVTFIEQLQQAGVDWSSAEPPGSDENAVHLMSVHKSKGLEYPVVFLVELNTRFSRQDTNDAVLMAEDGALGLQLLEQDTDARLDSLAHQVIAQTKARSSLAEELRILYVAVTRAKTRLVLTGCASQDECRDCVQARGPQETVPLWILQSRRNVLQWILTALAGQRSVQNALGLDAHADSPDLLETTLYGQDELRGLSDYVNQLGQAGEASAPARSVSVGAQIVRQLKETLDWHYAHQALTMLPGKRTVSQLVHPDPLAPNMDAMDMHSTAVQRLDQSPAERRDASVIGTATHLVLARCKWEGTVTASMIDALIQDLLDQQAMDAVTAQRIDRAAILAFGRSSLGQLARDAHKILREWPFTLNLPVQELAGYGLDLSPGDISDPDEYIVVQGIADLLIMNPEGLHLIDYKTDRVTPKQLPQRVKLYENQLRLYGGAAQAILQQRVAGKWLYFLHPGLEARIE